MAYRLFVANLQQDQRKVKNYEPKFSYILAELFKISPQKSCFLDCWKTSSVFPVYKKFGQRWIAKTCCPVSLLSEVSKYWETYK